MNEVLQTNVFFVITSVAVICLTVLVSIALVYLIRILRNISEMTERLKQGSAQLMEDAQAVRTFVHEGIIGFIKSSWLRFMSGGPASKTKRRRTGHDDEHSS